MATVSSFTIDLFVCSDPYFYQVFTSPVFKAWAERCVLSLDAHTEKGTDHTDM